MKIKTLLAIFTTSAWLVSCLAMNKPVCDFEVGTDAEDYYLAGQAVTFLFKGTADCVMFYSGETGHIYDNNSFRYEDNSLKVKFVSYQDGQNPVHGNCQFLISRNFDGNYSPEGVAAADWTDFSPEFGMATNSGVNTPSAELDIKDILPPPVGEENPTYYLAFRYFDVDPDNPVSNRWCIRSIDLTRILADGTAEPYSNMKSAGWQEIVLGGCPMWNIGQTQLLAQGSTSAIYQTKGKDVWAITKGFSPNKMEPDAGITVMSLATAKDRFSYVYNEPGTYEAVFACVSEWYNGRTERVIRKTIKVR